MHASLKAWLVPVLLLGTIAYAMAATYTADFIAPSPTGAYSTLTALDFSAQRVGIGTNAPTPFPGILSADIPTLQVNGPAADVRLTAVDAAGTVIVDGGLIASAAFNTFLVGGISPGTAVTFWTRDTASTPPTERARITGSGNVGIGTPTPTARLDVQGLGTGLQTTKIVRVDDGATPTPREILTVDDADYVTIGDASQGGKLTLRPRSGNPTGPGGWPLAPAGTLAYSSMNGTVYVSNNSAWVPASSAGGGKLVALEVYRAMAAGAFGTICPNPPGTGWAQVGQTAIFRHDVCMATLMVPNPSGVGTPLLAESIAMAIPPHGRLCPRSTPPGSLPSAGGIAYSIATESPPWWSQICIYKCDPAVSANCS